MLINYQLTPLDILLHIEELQKAGFEDDDAWKMYNQSIEMASSQMIKTAEEYREKNSIEPSYDLELCDVDPFWGEESWF